MSLPGRLVPTGGSSRQAAGAALACLLLAALAVPAAGQAPGRKATTVGSLLTYPLFFHGQAVVVHAELHADQDWVWLFDGEHRLLSVGAARPQAAAEGELFEAHGRLWDVGRLQPGDPRLGPHDFERISLTLLKRPWPGIGELIALVHESIEPARPPGAPTLRTLALQPQRYEGQQVTVTGRFRGRNLYGDLPQAPGVSRWDFVLQTADAAVWVTGMRPRGRGFTLDPGARVDTGHFVEVTGQVRRDRGLVLLDAAAIALAEEPDEPVAAPVAAAPHGPAPEVVFSAPVPREIDVPRDTDIRLQFSRDLAPASLAERATVGYVQPDGSLQPVPFTSRYDEGLRVLQIRLEAPFERFRVVRVELAEGITAFDGAPMAPWSLTFTTGA